MNFHLILRKGVLRHCKGQCMGNFILGVALRSPLSFHCSYLSTQSLLLQCPTSSTHLPPIVLHHAFIASLFAHRFTEAVRCRLLSSVEWACLPKGMIIIRLSLLAAVLPAFVLGAGSTLHIYKHLIYAKMAALLIYYTHRK